MSKRGSFSNATVVDMLAKSSGWTRDIPFKVITEILGATDEQGLMVKPAKDSESGRGCPVFDLYNPGLPLLDQASMTEPCTLSLKISNEPRLPRSIPLTCGTDRHIDGVYLSVLNSKYPIPVYVFNFNAKQQQWSRFIIDAARVFRENKVIRDPQARGNIVTKSDTIRPGSNGKEYHYTYLRINIKPAIDAGYGNWVDIVSPSLPKCHPFPV